MELWLSQALTVASGLIGLFFDPKNRKSWWAKPTLVFFIIVPAGLAIFSGHQKSQEATQQALRATEQHRKDQDKIAELLNKLQVVGEGVNTLLLVYGFTPESAATASPGRIAISQKANTIVNAAIQSANASTKAERQKITVQYFPKDVDPIVIKSTLSSLGFSFMEGLPQQKGATNAIWFGNDVPISDVKLVALTLVRAGVDLKTIRPFRKTHPVADRNLLIQVGTDNEFAGKPKLSLQDITSAQVFTRKD